MESFVRLQIQFSGNKLSGGGAYMYIPATLRIVGPSIDTQRNVLERIRKTIFWVWKQRRDVSWNVISKIYQWMLSATGLNVYILYFNKAATQNFLVAIWLVPVSLGQPCFVLVWPGPIRSQEKCIQKWISTALLISLRNTNHIFSNTDFETARLRLRLHYVGGIWNSRSTVYTNPSFKWSFWETLVKPEEFENAGLAY